MIETIRPYQDEGADFLHPRTFAYLADEPGLGKTAQAIVAADRAGAENILVNVPAGVRYNWRREFGRFSYRTRDIKLMFTKRDEPSKRGITVCSYDLLTDPMVTRSMSKVRFDVAINDEAHFLKNHEAKRTLAVYGTRCKGENGLISISSQMWDLSGTPAPNNASELYPVLRAFKVWNGNYWSFVEKFCSLQQGDYGIKIIGNKNVEELKKLMKPIFMRRKKSEILKDLPPITYDSVALDPMRLTDPTDLVAWKAAERGKEGAILQGLLDKLQANDGDVDAEMQLACAPIARLRRVTGIAKVRPVAELVTRELEEDQYGKIVIFAIHRDVLEGLVKLLKPFNATIIHGGVPQNFRQRTLHNFQNDPSNRVLAAQIQAAGTGIDGLQHACSQVLFAEESWTPTENAQAAMRVHRMGQKNPVMCRFAYLADSLDEQVTNVIVRKTQMVSELFS